MIWILLFSLIITSSDSPYLIPELDNYANQYVSDKSRSEKIVDLIKENRSEHKSLQKTNQANIKALNQLNYSRTTTSEEFEELFAKIVDDSKSVQQSDVALKLKIPEIFTSVEWELVKQDALINLDKKIKKKNKEIEKFKNEYNDFIEEASIIIKDEKRKDEMLKSMEVSKEKMLVNLQAYETYITNENSLIYTYEVTEKEMIEVFIMSKKWRDEAFDAYANNHFTIVEFTTPEEWKLIVNSIKKLD